MVELPAASNDAASPGAENTRPRRSGRSLGSAALAVAVGLASVVSLLVALAEPKLAPLFGPLAVLIGVGALWGAALADHRRLRADLARLAGENRRLAERHETLADAHWKLRDSEERYRGLAEAGEDSGRALIEARRKAEAASEAKSRFLAAVSHEFRTPLNGILGLNGLLLETPLTPDQETYAKAVQSSGEALLALIDDMLDFSKIESGRLDLHAEATSVEALFEEIVELLAGRAHAKGIDLAAEIDPALPNVAVDAARLRQVLINLVGNGIKFTETGGVTLAARAEASGPSVRIVFSVADSGAGIAVADAERIFGEFEQADTAIARRHGGVGLGLAISRRIVRRMGGDIDLLPRPGGGSIFSFTLDLPRADTPPPVPPPALARRRILILAPGGVEALAAAGALRRSMAEARIAAGTVEGAALAGAAAAAGLPYEGVLIDTRISADIAGSLARVREASGVPLPAVALIEPGERGRLDALRAGGFDAYLVRPVRRGSLLKIVGEVLAVPEGFRVDPADEQPRRGKPLRRAARQLNILLAEDNVVNALLARAVLEGLGHEVTEVRDGAAAVAAVKGGGRFDAILMDLHMPGLDGIAAARAIRAFEAEGGAAPAAILAVTADVLTETRAAAAAAGIDAILEKPVAPDALRRILADATGG